jgi:hypothetical protein
LVNGSLQVAGDDITTSGYYYYGEYKDGSVKSIIIDSVNDINLLTFSDHITTGSSLVVDSISPLDADNATNPIFNNFIIPAWVDNADIELLNKYQIGINLTSEAIQKKNNEQSTSNTVTDIFKTFDELTIDFNSEYNVNTLAGDDFGWNQPDYKTKPTNP